MAKSRVFLSLGSNLGEKKKNLRDAVKHLQNLLENLKVSSIYETLPLYVTEQPKFLNVVVRGFTQLPPSDLLNEVLIIEQKVGRNRRNSIPMGPRIIDIDILLYGERKINDENLVIPHPKIAERQFVLIPLLELDPGIRNPVTGEGYSKALHTLGPQNQGVYTFSVWDYTENRLTQTSIEGECR